MRPRALSTAVGVAVIVLAACREHGRPDPNIRMATSHEREVPAPADAAGSATGADGQAHAGKAPTIPNRLDVPDAVRDAYSGVVLAWQDRSSGKQGKLEVPFGANTEVPGAGLTVSSDVFLPAFAMSADAITSNGVEEGNPAARIRVVEGGKQIFSGWIFKQFPDVHPFTHARFSLRLDGGVRKPAK